MEITNNDNLDQIIYHLITQSYDEAYQLFIGKFFTNVNNIFYQNVLENHYCPMLAFVGDLKLLEEAWKNKHHITSTSLLWAAAGGHVFILEWLTSVVGLELDKRISTFAAEYGKINIIYWLSSKNFIFDSDTWDGVGISGNIIIAMWLYKNNVPWNKSVYAYAAENNHLFLIKWLRSKNCPWNQHAFTAAVDSENIYIITEILTMNCSINCCIYDQLENKSRIFKKKLKKILKLHNISLDNPNTFTKKYVEISLDPIMMIL